MVTYTATVFYAHNRELAQKLIRVGKLMGDDITEGITDIDGSVELVLETSRQITLHDIDSIKYFLSGYQFALTDIKANKLS